MKTSLPTIICLLVLFSFGINCLSQNNKSVAEFLKEYSDSAGAQKTHFGSNKNIPFAFEGKIYHLPSNTRRLPDFKNLKPAGSIYTTSLNIPTTRFSNGFPGVTDRFEWFAIDYKGAFYIKQDGEYLFQLSSDDGSKLLIDDSLVINNDGQHITKGKQTAVFFKKGIHKIEIQYFQGPRDYIALKLFVAKKGKGFKPFDTLEFFPGEITFEGNELKIELGSEILFGFNKSALKKEAQDVLLQVKEHFIDFLENPEIIVEGHTDNIGNPSYNYNLSQKRAKSVNNYFVELGLLPSKLKIKAYGEQKPKFPNDSDKNRAKNRRVEIRVKQTP